MRQAMQSVYVPPVGEALGYELRNQIIDILDAQSEPQAARYRLSLVVHSQAQAIGVQSQKIGTMTQTTVTRYNDRLTVDYELTDMQTKAVLTKGTEIGLSAYNIMSSPYATVVAQQNADKRAVDDIAYRVRIALAAYFSQAK